MEFYWGGWRLADAVLHEPVKGMVTVSDLGLELCDGVIEAYEWKDI